jgi:hypothetical protein
VCYEDIGPESIHIKTASMIHLMDSFEKTYGADLNKTLTMMKGKK